MHYNHRAGGGASAFWGDYTDSPSAPLHPFGFGLSTTSFTYSELEITAGTTAQPTTVAVTVTNDGPSPSATPATLTIGLPAGIEIVAVDGGADDWSCDGRAAAGVR